MVDMIIDEQLRWHNQLLIDYSDGSRFEISYQQAPSAKYLYADFSSNATVYSYDKNNNSFEISMLNNLNVRQWIKF